MRVLVVEDHEELAETVALGLRREGMAVDVAFDGATALQRAIVYGYDVIVLDRDLPEVHGDHVCEKLVAEGGRARVLMLTASAGIEDRVAGLSLGADDYLPKPFHLRELLARVKSVLRRVQSRTGEPSQTTRTHARFAGWDLDLSSRELTSPAGQEVRLTTGEFDLLAAFVNNPNQVLSRDRLLDLARNREAGPFDRTIDVQVGRLRRKLEDDPQNPSLIKTVRGSGYIFTPTVEMS